MTRVQATENQRLLAATGCWEGDKGGTLPQSLQEEATLPTPSCKTPASRTVRERIFVALSHRVCGHLLQQTQETNTDPLSQYVLRDIQSNNVDDKGNQMQGMPAPSLHSTPAGPLSIPTLPSLLGMGAASPHSQPCGADTTMVPRGLAWPGFSSKDSCVPPASPRPAFAALPKARPVSVCSCGRVSWPLPASTLPSGPPGLGQGCRVEPGD